MPYQKYVAELLGAFVLALMVGLSLALKFPVPTPLVAGLTLGLFVYTVGGLSGAHLNPAVTVGMLAVKKISPNDAIAYLVAQLAGGFLAMKTIAAVTTPVALVAGNTWGIALAEAAGAFVLAFGVSAVVSGKVNAAASGIVVGWSLLSGILLASGFSNGIINPAVALGLGSLSATYVLAPIAGAVIGSWLYRWLMSK